jgi:hypothetical protein
VEEKVSLPIKTKIVAWWIIICGIFGFYSYVSELIAVLKIFHFQFKKWLEVFLLSPAGFSPLFFHIIFPILLGVFLLKKKKWSWWCLVVFLFLNFSSILIILIEPGIMSVLPFFSPEAFFIKFFLELVDIHVYVTVFGLLTFAFFNFVINLIPFIFLLLDRKNFWKVTS